MASQSLYRKWRSQTFSDLIGQEAVTRTLLNAVRDGRLAHAYLFCGPRGIGKTSAARLLAKAVNCANPHNGEPCNECLSCREITTGRSPDVIEIDAASNTGVDNIRDLRENVGLMGVGGHYKVYIVDEVHMLSTAAFNALLKTLEEPPPHIIFVLATTEAHKVLPTVVSRCQRFDFRRFGMRDLVQRLYHVAEGEGLEIEPEAAELLARAAQGGMRDALSLLDQALAFCGTTIDLARTRAMLGLADAGTIRQLIAFVADGDAAGGLHLINEMVTTGADLRQLNSQLGEEWRALVLARAGANVAELMDCTDDEANARQALAARFSLEELTASARVFARNETPARGLPMPQLALELSFLDCLRIHTHGTVEVQQAGQHTTRPAPTPPRPAQPPQPVPTSQAPQSAVSASLPATPAPAQPARPAAQVERAIEDLDLDAIERGDAAPAPDIWGTQPDNSMQQVVESIQPTDVQYAADEPGILAEIDVPPAASESEQLLEMFFRAQSQWDLIKQVCKQKSRSVAALLHSASPVRVEPGDVPVLVLQATYQFHLDKLREPTSRAAVEWALTQVLEVPMRIRLTLGVSGNDGNSNSSGGFDNGGNGNNGGSNGGNGNGGVKGRVDTENNTYAADVASPSRRNDEPIAYVATDAINTETLVGAIPASEDASASNLRSFTAHAKAATANSRTNNSVRDESASYTALEGTGINNISTLRRAPLATAIAEGASRPQQPPEMRQLKQNRLETEVRADPVIQNLLRTQGIELVDVRPLDDDE